MGVDSSGVPVVGSPSQALRKKGSGMQKDPRPDRLSSLDPFDRSAHPKTTLPQVLRPLGVDTLGFDPRKVKDDVENGEVSKLKVEINQRGTAIAKQQCLAVNLVQLLSQVMQFYAPDKEGDINSLPPVEEIFQLPDQGIYDLLQTQYHSLYSAYRARERSHLLPGLSSLFSVAEERKATPRRGLRSFYTIVKEESPSFPTYNLGIGCGAITDLFAVSSAGCYPALSKLQGLHDIFVNGRDTFSGISIERAREAFLAGDATDAEKRLLREHKEGEAKDTIKTDSPTEVSKKRRKSSGHFFVWGECVIEKTAPDDAADDVFMEDLAGEEVKERKKKVVGRKKRLSVSINDEIEPTQIVDDQGVFHFGDFAVDTTGGGGYDYGTYGGGGASNASAMDFAFGDFAIGVDEEMVRKHEPQFLAKKHKLALDLPKKVMKPGGLTIVNYRVTHLLGHAVRVKCVAIAPDERHILSCSHEDVIVVLSDIETGKEMVSFSGHDDTLTSVAFSQDQKHVATTSRDQNLILWDAITAKVLLQFEHDKVVICCAWSKSGRLIVSGCQDKVCRVWDTKKGKERAAFTEHVAIIISLDFAPDDKHVVSASADKTVRIWSASNGQSVRVLKGHSGIVLGCRYLSDGKQILSNDENEIKLWDVKTGACKLSMHVENIQMALPIARSTKKRFTWTLCSACPGDFSNYIIASCNLRTVIIFDRHTGEEILTFYTRAPVYCLASSIHDKVVLGDSVGNIYVIRLQGV
eukprot:TRINITY_DN14590_c0_g1_i2.p1 TRINITY_DN14590_c0_g1~~TRINITY_DN14590_c0_g1_i2.p1  ORF type:complete len:748 (+),score=247.41 TRINITY_DN14590_c0_g1_i2:174-2417(+)